MRVSDLLAGLLAAAAGVLIAGYASTFPPMPGQPVGPGLFPTVVGCGFILFGGALALARHGGGRPMLVLEPWATRPRAVGSFALVVAVLLFYAAAVHVLGFFITATLGLIVLFAAFGVRLAWIVPIALLVTVAIHYGFYTLLRVPLPWGLLESVAW